MKIKFNSDDKLPLNKQLEFLSVTIVIIWTYGPILAIHKAFVILLLKHNLIFLKLITRFITIKTNYESHYQIHYKIHYQIHQMSLDLNHH